MSVVLVDTIYTQIYSPMLVYSDSTRQFRHYPLRASWKRETCAMHREDAEFGEDPAVACFSRWTSTVQLNRLG